MKDTFYFKAKGASMMFPVGVFERLKVLLRENDGAEMEATIGKFETKVSVQQHRYYRGVILKQFADTTGNDPDDLHKFFAEKFLNKGEFNLCGEFSTRIRSTADLTIKEMTEFIDKVVLWIHEHFPDFVFMKFEDYQKNLKL